MRRILFLVAAAASVTACAPPAGTTSPATANTTTRVLSGGNDASADVVVNPDVATVSTALAVPPERAWAALHVAYADLQVPVVRADSARLTLGNPRFRVSRRLGREPLSSFFDCGRSLGGVPLAESYRLDINLSSAVVAAPGGSELRTATTAMAYNLDGASRDPVVCHSTGRLERHVSTLVQARLLR